MLDKGVSETLRKVLFVLSKLSSLSNFALGGGTNLAMRYNHRISDDIDLFCPEIIGKKGFDKISEELKSSFKNIKITFPIENENEQFIFLRAYIFIKNEAIKVELIQNTKRLRDIEIKNNIRLLSELDIGVMKLLAISGRNAKKDVYDLVYITDNKISLIELYEALQKKEEKYNLPIHKTIFDLDESVSPTQNMNALFYKEEKSYSYNSFKPSHSSDSIKNTKETEKWGVIKFMWRNRVKELHNRFGKKYAKRNNRYKL